MTKVCVKCKVRHEIEQFAFRQSNPGHVRVCNICKIKSQAERGQKWYWKNKELHRERVLKRKFGITHSDYLKMLENQRGGCAICGSKEARANRKYLCVDHDHSTNKVRGLLCIDCNHGIGKFKDSENLLLKAIKYLSGSFAQE